MAILKPNIPLKYVKPDGTTQSEYPLTSIDQVIDEDGIHRLNQTIVRADLSDVGEGQVVLTNADLLENHPASYYLNPLIAYPIGSVYFSVNDTNPSTILGGGTWELIGSKLAVRENVFGNGYGLALTNGTSIGELNNDVAYDYGANVSTHNYPKTVYYHNDRAPTYSPVTGLVGIPTKSNLGSNPQYSGLILDTETIYSWKRVA